MNSFSKPYFLTKFCMLEEFEHRPGRTVEVRSLRSLPMVLRDRISSDVLNAQGYVIKYYHDDPVAQRSLYFGSIVRDPSLKIGTGTQAELVERIPLHKKLSILKNRQALLADFFAQHGLEDIIVPSLFILSRDENVQFRIYEIQERLFGYINLDTDKLDAYVESLTLEQRQRLLEQIRKFKKAFLDLFIYTDHEIYSEYKPDLHQNNIALTADGDIRIYDTNLLHEKDHPHSKNLAFHAKTALDWLIESLEDAIAE